MRLGGTAHGTSQEVVKATTLKPYPTDIRKTKDHLAALIDRYAAVAKSIRKAIDKIRRGGRRWRGGYLHRLLTLARQVFAMVLRRRIPGKGVISRR